MRMVLGVTGGLVTLIAVLGCSGLGSTSGTSASSGSIPNVSFVDNGISKSMQRGAAPKTASARVRKGQYVMKLKEGVGRQSRVNGGRFESDRPGLGDRANKAGLRNARRVHGEAGSARNKQGRHQDTFRVDSDMEINALRSAMGNDDVAWIEPVIEYDPFNINDPYYDYQWNLEALQIPNVHARSTGQGMVVAVIDSGVTPGPDGLSKVLQGYDFFDDDSDPSDTDEDKTTSGSHGTHVAGTVAQATGNGEGVAGVAPGASILPVRVMGYMSEVGAISSTNEIIAAGITWSVDNGADVINLSLGSYTESQVIADSLDYAYRNNVVVVAASGNSGYTDTIAFPASHSTVISVGAVGANNTEPSYSNTSNQLDLVAPGGDLTVDVDGDGYEDGIVQETVLGGEHGYAFFQGTSMASPHVAAAAAILRANGLRTVDEVREALTMAVDDIGKRYGALNILKALDYTPTGRGRASKGSKSRGDNVGRGGKSGARGGDAAPGRDGARGGDGSRGADGARGGRGGGGRGR